MRIIAGRFKSLIFDAPNYGKHHPMSDRGRMALFNMLGDISNLELVLDAYAGSGALGFEALSRGVKRAVLVENNQRVYKQLIKNIAQLKLEALIDAYKANNTSLVPNLDLYYDLMFLDPPYDNLSKEALLKLAQFVKRDGLLVLSHPPHFKTPFDLKSWQLLNDKQYAQLHLKIYQRL